MNIIQHVGNNKKVFQALRYFLSGKVGKTKIIKKSYMHIITFPYNADFLIFMEITHEVNQKASKQ